MAKQQISTFVHAMLHIKVVHGLLIADYVSFWVVALKFFDLKDTQRCLSWRNLCLSTTPGKDPKHYWFVHYTEVYRIQSYRCVFA